MGIGALRLRNPVRHYDWGSPAAIAEILGEPPGDAPWAELWMGAHPSAPSQVETPEGLLPLDVWIARDPEAALGPARAGAGPGSLPFLFKILSAARPLSIQAHPDGARARAGFARENAAGIPLDAPERCYRDPNPKPELICALTPFRALNRFRDSDAIAEAFGALDFPPPAGGDPRALLAALFALGASEREALLSRATNWARGAGRDHDGSAWLLELADAHPGDAGALAPLFLNVVELAPGEAMYLPPGELHAYLEGTGLELMASSDNVLRGGLTHKHIDPGELLAALAERSGPVERLRPEPRSQVEAVYRTPAPEFELSLIHTRSGGDFQARTDRGAEILLCLEGACELHCPGEPPLRLERGQSAFVPASAPAYRLVGVARTYRAAPGNEASSPA